MLLFVPDAPMVLIIENADTIVYKHSVFGAALMEYDCSEQPARKDVKAVFDL